MQETVEAAKDSKSYIIDDHARILYEQFKDTTFERILVMAFAREYDLAQIILNNALPKGQRHFSEGDVREFIARFNKQIMQVSFFVAKNAILTTGRPALALEGYETALHNLVREFSRRLGAIPQQHEAVVPAETAPAQSNPPPPAPAPSQTLLQQEAPLSTVRLMLDPLWSVIFPLPVLLGWLGNLRPWPLIGMALCSSVTFTVAHGKHGWRAWLLFCSLGNLLSLAAVFPIALCDREAIHFPVLPYGAGLPLWVNASLWGITCAMIVHLLSNIWLRMTQKPRKAVASKAHR